MKQDDIMIFAIVTLIFWGIILTVIIRSANDTNKRDRIQLQNQDLLALIAEKLGVEAERINEVIRGVTKKKK